MPIEFACPQCRTQLRVPDGTEGRETNCPSCGFTSVIPFPAGDGLMSPAPPSPPSPFSAPSGLPTPEPQETGNPYQTPTYAPGAYDTPLVSESFGPITPTRVPMGKLVGSAWRLMKAQYGMILGVMLLTAVCAWIANTVAGMFISLPLGAVVTAMAASGQPDAAQVVNFVGQLCAAVVQLAVQTYFYIGATKCLVDLGREGRADIADIFRQGHLYIKAFLGQLLYTLISWAFALLVVAGFVVIGFGFAVGAVDWGGVFDGPATPSPEEIAQSLQATLGGSLVLAIIIGILWTLAVMSAQILVMVKFGFFYIDIAARGSGVIEAYRTSSRITRGNVLKIATLLLMVIFLFYIPVIVAFITLFGSIISLAFTDGGAAGASMGVMLASGLFLVLAFFAGLFLLMPFAGAFHASSYLLMSGQEVANKRIPHAARPWGTEHGDYLQQAPS